MVMGKVMGEVRVRVTVGVHRNARGRRGHSRFCFAERCATVGARAREPLYMMANACATTTP